MSEHDRDVDMREEYDFSQARRGPILPPMAGKTRISIRIDTDVLEWFRDQVRYGGNYQTLMNQALRNYMSRAHENVHDVRPLVEASQCLTLNRHPLPPPASSSIPLDAFSHLINSLHELVQHVVREELERTMSARREPRGT
jgi:uncharacterized protein (DUF4415 family)